MELELPLPPYDSCRLVAVNLYPYVLNPFTKEATLNAAGLFDDIMSAQRIMDDIVDIEIEKIDVILAKINGDDSPEHLKVVERNLWLKIRGMAEDSRRTGLGYTGLGDMMAALNITYGTDAAINFISELQQLFGSASYTSSIALAEERGAFPLWSYEKDQESDFIKRMMSKDNILMTEEILEKYELYGRRNIGNLTLAPTGTVSLMTQTTSGIEPLFSPWYFRKKKTDDKSKATVIDESGDMWEEFAVFHKPFVDWFVKWNLLGLNYDEGLRTLRGKSESDLKVIFEASPYYKATAQDVDYVNKVKMQGKAQEWVDHSISVTVNMPNEATESTVRDVYIEAWRSGCKGVTVYRDGSRLGVLNVKRSEDKETSDFDYIKGHKRPHEVKHDVYFKKRLGEEYMYLVGIENGKPYEIFGLPYSKSLGVPKTVKYCTVTKVKKKHFRFESGEYVIENIIDHMIETEQTQTRDYSLMLRHRINPKFIRKSILHYATITSFQKGLASILDNYIEDDYEGETCQECGGRIVKVEGCMKCIDCGHSKCG